ncbi:MAG: hypothetical protein ABIY52_13980 [Gemmatimonadaceae bacterium]
MTNPQVLLGELVGRRVRDDEGRVIGRVLELSAEIALREHDRDYVVTTYHVASFGHLDRIAGSRFMQQLIEMLGPRMGCHRYLVPWDIMDITDPRRPRLRRPLDPRWHQGPR